MVSMRKSHILGFLDVNKGLGYIYNTSLTVSRYKVLLVAIKICRVRVLLKVSIWICGNTSVCHASILEAQRITSRERSGAKRDSREGRCVPRLNDVALLSQELLDAAEPRRPQLLLGFLDVVVAWRRVAIQQQNPAADYHRVRAYLPFQYFPSRPVRRKRDLYCHHARGQFTARLVIPLTSRALRRALPPFFFFCAGDEIVTEDVNTSVTFNVTASIGMRERARKSRAREEQQREVWKIEALSRAGVIPFLDALYSKPARQKGTYPNLDRAPRLVAFSGWCWYEVGLGRALTSVSRERCACDVFWFRGLTVGLCRVVDTTSLL